MWYKNLGRTLVRFVTIHACDGQTDRRTDGHLCRRKDRPACMQRGKNQNLSANKGGFNDNTFFNNFIELK